MITVTLYLKNESDECARVKDLLASLYDAYPHQTILIDIDKESSLRSAYAARVPVVHIGPYILEGEVTRERLMVALGAAQDRARQLEQIDQKAYQDKLDRGHTFSSGDRLSLWISDHFLSVLNLILFLYIGLPFLAPVLMKNGAEPAANIIYKIYSPVCHQLAYRSWFLFGEQPYYPRELAGVPGVIPYEQATGLTGQDIQAGRAFLGNANLGYKVAICERDVAIYLAILIFGLVFQVSGKRIRSLPWYLWLAIGLIPIGLDGFSQLPSVINGLPSWLPIRESTPFLRTLTGGLFGLMTAWYLYPLMEQSMRETRRMLLRKQAISTQSGIGD